MFSENWSVGLRRWRAAPAALVLCVLAMFVGTSVRAAPPPAGTVIQGTATASYVPAGFTQTETVSSNTVFAVVLPVEALVLTQDQSVARPPGTVVTLSHLLTNTGNVASSYTLSFVNNGAGCAADTLDLSALRIVRDSNNNGVVDANDPALGSGVAGTLSLQPGETASLLVQGTIPDAPNGSACLTLSATTALQGLVAVNHDTVTIVGTAVISLIKSASYPGSVVPGQTRIDFSVAGTNIGVLSAQPSNVAAGSTPVLVNGTPTALILLHDLIPAGTQYIPATLRTAAANSVKLFRLPSDPPFSYRTTEDASAIEVAIGVSTPIASNASIGMQFAVTVQASEVGDIRNTAQSDYNDSVNPASSTSNTVVISSSGGRIGVAKAASTPLANLAANGQPDGTATVHFSVNVRNYGSVWLYGVQAPDVMEGAGATQFGTYTSAVVPSANQYTIVPGTVAIASNQGNAVSGTVAVANAAFTGTTASPNLLADGAVLPVGAQFTVQFDARINLTGRSGTLLNAIRASAALTAGGPAAVFDDSVNGSDPDPDGDGNPNNNSSATPVSTQLPALTLLKTSSPPRQVAPGVFEIDYALKVTNTGAAPAPNVRLIDNLNCTFDIDQPTGSIASWVLVTPPKSAKGVLVAASGFTGRAPCNNDALTSADPFDFPTETVLSATDGSRALAPGQSDTVSFTVRATEKPAAASGTPVTVDNKAWAAALTQNTINVTRAIVVVAATSSAQTLLAPPAAPGGIVYNAATRQPVAGALVTYTRQSCSAGPATPIVPAEISGAATGLYTFNTNGSVSMTTPADGSYAFQLLSPPIGGLCTYALSVTPPAGSGLVFPSQLIPAARGSFSSCGAVTSNTGAPQNGDATTYYTSVVAGRNPDGSACNVTGNKIPLDAGNILGLLLQKESSKSQAELGDFVDYALVATNKTGLPVTGIAFSDKLPPGFAYVPNSARLNGAVAAEPGGGTGPTLVFSDPSLVIPAAQTVTLRYRVRIGVGAPTNGGATNVARATSGSLTSNQASATVQVSGGVFADDAFAFGKVYMACQRDGDQQGTDLVGVPGVRLFMENGTSVTTDVEGKWSLYGLKPITHVLRIDQTTLPPGATLGLLDNRNSGSPESRFVDLKKGEFQKANFVISNCDDPAVLADVIARRAAIAAHPAVEMEAQVIARLDPEGKIVPVGDVRGLAASGQIAGGAGGSVAPPGSAPLIALPIEAANASTYVSGANKGGTLSGAQPPAATPTGSLFASINGLPTNGLPSSPTAGSATGAGAAATRPIATSSAMLEPHAPALLPRGAPSPIELEALLPKVDSNALGFIDLKEGDTVAGQSINVRVKGEAGTSLRLSVNDQPLDDKRVGKKAQFASKNLVAWEYIGVALKPGRNVLEVQAVDDFGVTRGTPAQIRITAPDKLGAIEVDVPVAARADLRTPVPIKVRLVDAAGVPVTARTQLTLEADRGRWLDEDLNPTEPGTQVFMEGGVAEFRLMPPGEPGDVRIRVSAGSFVKEVRLSLLPERRPMIGLGIVEGVLDLTKRGSVPLGAMPAGAAFETELSGMTSGGDSTRAAARTAFFFKGTVKGDYLLTAAFDSDKTKQDTLFRDIRPDEFYPIYGDSSAKGFDAQSTQKLYVRIDKDHSFLLYGDFTTASSPEVRSLSQSNRSLTGLKHVYEDENVRTTSFVSRTAQVQQIEEFRALGTSGPYYLSATTGDFVENSEQVEILVRDGHQPNVVLQRTAVSRNVDYTIEPLTRRILFTSAIASVDANLNPQSIRVTYEVDGGGPKFTVAGTDVQVKVNDRLQVGAVASTDQNPGDERKLQAVTAIARLGDHTTVAAEAVKTQTDASGEGRAGRIELRHQDDQLAVVAQASRTGTGFDNPGASFSAGQTAVSARAEYRIDPSLAVRAEAIRNKDALTAGNDSNSESVSLQKKLSPGVVAEVGVRHGQSNAASNPGFDYGQVSTYNGSTGSANSTTGLGAAATAASTDTLTTVRARLASQIPDLPNAQVFVEAEQDVSDSGRHVLGIGGNYAITDKTRVYGRYELISSLNDPSQLDASQSNNVGIVGIESAYMDGGRVYNEYRVADSIDGRGVIGALGVRNTFKLSDHWRATAGLEQTSQLSNVSNSVNDATGFSGGLGNSTAVTGGLEYGGDEVRGSGILEARHGSDADTALLSIGAAYKLSPATSVLARIVQSNSKGLGANAGNEHDLQRAQIGIAYRPVDDDTWNLIARYEHRSERVIGTGNATGSISGSSVFGTSDAALPGTSSADIVSTTFNYNPRAGRVFTARYAGKLSRADDGTLASTYWAHLLQGRFTQDLSKDWDLGVQLGALYGQGGGLQKTAGVELGYQVAKDLWLSSGYNFVGLSDRDLTANQYTSQGAYIRLRFKFDETNLGFASAGAVNAAPRVVAPAPAPEPAPEVVPQPPVVVPPEHAPEAPILEKMTLKAETLFDTNRAAIRPGADEKLIDLVSRLRTINYDVVILIGHADSTGAADYNQRLSEKRAIAVRDFLIAHGADASRVRAESRGSHEPIASNATPQGRAQNRRVEIEILGRVAP